MFKQELLIEKCRKWPPVMSSLKLAENNKTSLCPEHPSVLLLIVNVGLCVCVLLTAHFHKSIICGGCTESCTATSPQGFMDYKILYKIW